jgi:hypothetical protein
MSFQRTYAPQGDPIMQSSVATKDVFAQARAHYSRMEEWLRSAEAMSETHSELEEKLSIDSRELLREMLQSHLNLRHLDETRMTDVEGADGRLRRHVEESERGLMSVFGPVRVARLSYGGRGMSDLHPADGGLNLPAERASHGLRKVAAEEACKSSFDETVKAIDRYTGGQVAKRQVQELVKRAAQDFDDFYAAGIATPKTSRNGDLLVLSSDGKGIVVLHRYLREATRKAAEATAHKLDGRLSPGEKKNRKRRATVAAVYSVSPFIRTPEDILADLRPVRSMGKPRPKAYDKRVWASVEKESRDIISAMFEEAERRDPGHRRQWVVLVDGDPYQITDIENEAARRGVEVTIVLDLIHVLEYLWKAAWCFFEKGDEDAQIWVTERARAILEGKSSDVAAGIRRSATLQGLSEQDRKGVDTCCDYLIAKRPYLHYDEYLLAGFPISTGVIEGACRHLICDRLDITGARWGLPCAEAVLQIRALRSSNDFDAYWAFHLSKENERNHQSRYANGMIPIERAA